MLLQCFKHLYFNGNKLLYGLHSYLHLHNTVRVSKVNVMNHFQDTEKCNLLLILGLLLPLGGLLDRVQVREAEAASILPARADLEV